MDTGLDIRRVRGGVRLRQHGVVLSAMRSTPGPTHSVFDVLAAAVAVLEPAGRVGVLGFAAGGIMAPLQALGFGGPIEAVDLDPAGYRVYRAHCQRWAGEVRWQQADALEWLRAQPARFGLLLDDLSVPEAGDVVKPALCWEQLPLLMRRRIRGGGYGVFNLFSPAGGRWSGALEQIARLFGRACWVELEEFENRFVLAGTRVPAARELGAALRRALRRIRSRQADRIRVHTVR
jgi:hypothetical protein